MAERYDAIVIGAGIGGLTCGAMLARSGRKVLVLEKHTKIGGYAHSFKRRKFTFESGIHCVPIAHNGVIMHLLNLLGVGDMIETEILPEMYSVHTPEFSYTMPPERTSVEEYLYRTFPKEKDGIARLLQSLEEFYTVIEKPVLDFEDNFVAEDKEFVSRYHNKTYKDYIDSFVNDEHLRFLLYGQWPYGGATPESAPTVFYAIMYIIHVIEGSHTLKGGFGTLADALKAAIERRGGTVKTKTTVTGLRTEGEKVVGVTCSSGEEYEGDLVVSNISPYTIHNEFLPEESRSKRWCRRLSSLKPSVSSMGIYLGMKPEVNDLLDKNVNFWFEHTDSAKIYQNILHDRKDSIDHLVLLRSHGQPQYPTVTLMNFAQKSLSNDWQSDKMRYADMMLEKAEDLYPGLNDLIEIKAVGSPATFERYTGNTDGALYGFESTYKMYGEAKMPMVTHLRNLFQVGHWGKPGGGVHNVMVNAYTTYHVIKMIFG